MKARVKNWWSVMTDDDAIEILDTDTPAVPFRFSKKATTDDIVNIDADLIDMDSFHYLNKHSLVKAIVYMIKSVYQLNKDLSSVVLSRKGTDKVVQETVDTGMEFVNKPSGLIQTQYVRTQIYSVNRLNN